MGTGPVANGAGGGGGGGTASATRLLSSGWLVALPPDIRSSRCCSAS